MENDYLESMKPQVIQLIGRLCNVFKGAKAKDWVKCATAINNLRLPYEMAGDKDFSSIIGLMFDGCMFRIEKEKIREQDIYPIFNHAIGFIDRPFFFVGSKEITPVYNHKMDKANRPDAWVRLGLFEDCELAPVEIKLHEFNITALRQLLRYLDFYKCNYGIAVGERLTTEIPNNIFFVSIKELDKTDNECRNKWGDNYWEDVGFYE